MSCESPFDKLIRTGKISEVTVNLRLKAIPPGVDLALGSKVIVSVSNPYQSVEWSLCKQTISGMGKDYLRDRPELIGML